MSQRHAVQDATGVIVTDLNGDPLILVGRTDDVPANGVDGYAPGCIFINTQTGKVLVNDNAAVSPNVANFDVIGSVTS